MTARKKERLHVKVVIILQIREIGEFGLIKLIKENTICDSKGVIQGIGDDAAVYISTPQSVQLLSTDMLVESVHFDLRTTSAWQLGYKTVAVNISDIAAMGGTPKHIVVSLALPDRLPVDFVTNLYDGMKSICRQFFVNIIGGDTVYSPHDLVINVSIVGEAVPEKVVKRSGAQVGDLVVVTGSLGNSAAGLQLLTKGGYEENDFTKELIKAHLTPVPQVLAGRTAAMFGATSMNDISDGLVSELSEIAKASNVTIKIEAAAIPVSRELIETAALFENSPLYLALYGGEDYQLVFTIARDRFAVMMESNPGLPLTAIGEVVDTGQSVFLVDDQERQTVLEAKGYNHFR